MTAFRAYVGSLAPTAAKKDVLLQAFSEYGPERVDVVEGRKSAVIHFPDAEDLAQALKGMNGRQLHGMPLVVTDFVPKLQRQLAAGQRLADRAEAKLHSLHSNGERGGGRSRHPADEAPGEAGKPQQAQQAAGQGEGSVRKRGREQDGEPSSPRKKRAHEPIVWHPQPFCPSPPQPTRKKWGKQPWQRGGQQERQREVSAAAAPEGVAVVGAGQQQAQRAQGQDQGQGAQQHSGGSSRAAQAKGGGRHSRQHAQREPTPPYHSPANDGYSSPHLYCSPLLSAAALMEEEQGGGAEDEEEEMGEGEGEQYSPGRGCSVPLYDAWLTLGGTPPDTPPTPRVHWPKGVVERLGLDPKKYLSSPGRSQQGGPSPADSPRSVEAIAVGDASPKSQRRQCPPSRSPSHARHPPPEPASKVEPQSPWTSRCDTPTYRPGCQPASPASSVNPSYQPSKYVPYRPTSQPREGRPQAFQYIPTLPVQLLDLRLQLGPGGVGLPDLPRAGRQQQQQKEEEGRGLIGAVVTGGEQQEQQQQQQQQQADGPVRVKEQDGDEGGGGPFAASAVQAKEEGREEQPPAGPARVGGLFACQRSHEEASADFAWLRPCKPGPSLPRRLSGLGIQQQPQQAEQHKASKPPRRSYPLPQPQPIPRVHPPRPPVLDTPLPQGSLSGKLPLVLTTHGVPCGRYGSHPSQQPQQRGQQRRERQEHWPEDNWPSERQGQPGQRQPSLQSSKPGPPRQPAQGLAAQQQQAQQGPEQPRAQVPQQHLARGLPSQQQQPQQPKPSQFKPRAPQQLAQGLHSQQPQQPKPEQPKPGPPQQLARGLPSQQQRAEQGGTAAAMPVAAQEVVQGPGLSVLIPRRPGTRPARGASPGSAKTGLPRPASEPGAAAAAATHGTHKPAAPAPVVARPGIRRMVSAAPAAAAAAAPRAVPGGGSLQSAVPARTAPASGPKAGGLQGGTAAVCAAGASPGAVLTGDKASGRAPTAVQASEPPLPTSIQGGSTGRQQQPSSLRAAASGGGSAQQQQRQQGQRQQASSAGVAGNRGSPALQQQRGQEQQPRRSEGGGGSGPIPSQEQLPPPCPAPAGTSLTPRQLQTPALRLGQGPGQQAQHGPALALQQPSSRAPPLLPPPPSGARLFDDSDEENLKGVPGERPGAALELQPGPLQAEASAEGTELVERGGQGGGGSDWDFLEAPDSGRDYDSDETSDLTTGEEEAMEVEDEGEQERQEEGAPAGTGPAAPAGDDAEYRPRRRQLPPRQLNPLEAPLPRLPPVEVECSNRTQWGVEKKALLHRLGTDRAFRLKEIGTDKLDWKLIGQRLGVKAGPAHSEFYQMVHPGEPGGDKKPTPAEKQLVLELSVLALLRMPSQQAIAKEIKAVVWGQPDLHGRLQREGQDLLLQAPGYANARRFEIILWRLACFDLKKKENENAIPPSGAHIVVVDKSGRYKLLGLNHDSVLVQRLVRQHEVWQRVLRHERQGQELGQQDAQQGAQQAEQPEPPVQETQ